MNDMEKKLREIVAKIAETDSGFAPDADFRDELGLDSYRGVELIFEVERVFGVRIPPERYAEMKTLRESMALVNSLS